MREREKRKRKRKREEKQMIVKGRKAIALCPWSFERSILTLGYVNFGPLYTALHCTARSGRGE